MFALYSIGFLHKKEHFPILDDNVNIIVTESIILGRYIAEGRKNAQ